MKENKKTVTIEISESVYKGLFKVREKHFMHLKMEEDIKSMSVFLEENNYDDVLFTAFETLVNASDELKEDVGIQATVLCNAILLSEKCK